jgi:hypothetical protein
MEIKIRKIGEEHFMAHGYEYRAVTKVFFKDGSALTFSAKLSRKDAIFNAYYQKGRDAGMTVEEAAVFAGKGAV